MQEITLEALLDRILCADAEELSEIIDTVAERFGKLWPDWELTTLSIHGHTAEAHVSAFQQALDLIRKNDLP